MEKAPSEDHLAIPAMKVQSLRDIVLDSLRVAITTGYLKAGDHLKERELSERMGISTTPIKEAFRILEYEGLVKTHPRKGTFVNESIDTLLNEILHLRAAVESLAARLAASKVTDEECERFRSVLADMSDKAANKNRDGLAAANERFHALVRETCGNPLIVNILTTISAFGSGFRKRALEFDSEMALGFQEHRAIIEAIVSRDPELAEQKMKQHIVRTIRDVLAGEAGHETSR
ncbi:GntR family transcriptional regulator [Paenibacillus cymbidii]|uniref:GntR family transcriptional regulator n=1 Tax=Paenibacillus cymbidii TaxID=1639034 RepID=UPI001081C37C|nr:GntR family transcriptional regulator [Paenibacillus cymbidii]